MFLWFAVTISSLPFVTPKSAWPIRSRTFGRKNVWCRRLCEQNPWHTKSSNMTAISGTNYFHQSHFCFTQHHFHPETIYLTRKWWSCASGATNWNLQWCLLAYMFLMKRIISEFNRSWIHGHILWCQLLLNWVIIIFIKYPASALLTCNYCCWLPMTDGPACARSPKNS